MIEVYEDVSYNEYKLKGIGNLSFVEDGSIVATNEDGDVFAIMGLDEINSGYWKLVPRREG